MHILILLLTLLGVACAAEPVRSMLVIGDSISRHGPSEPLGWSGTWGMAASAEEKDWAHLLQARIAAAQGAAVVLRVDGEGGGRISGKLARLDAITATAADLVLVQLGENENTPELEKGLEAEYDALIAGLRKAMPSARVLCFAVWTGAAGTSAKDAAIRRVCERQGAEFVSLAQANSDRANRAEADKRWRHPGVNWHPGDRGMQAYADAAWRVLQRQAEAPADPPVAIASAGVVLVEDFADPATVPARWQGSGSADDGGWRIALDKAGVSSLTTPVPAERIAGRQVRLSARIRSVDASVRPKPYNGIKVMLITTDAEGGKWYPQVQTSDGTQAWHVVERIFAIPATVVKAELRIGLEAVSGSVWFDDVRLETLPSP